jgi:hypothetical protein
LDQIDIARIPLHARRTMANRHDSSPYVLELLAADPDPDVRMAVAGHPSTPTAALRRLAGDGVARVAARAGIMVLAQRVTG